MRIDALALERHHADHIAPVWDALPPGSRGTFYVPEGVQGDVAAETSTAQLPGGDGPLVVSSSGALRAALRAGRTRIAMMEHGSGQSFGGGPRHARENASYAGGAGREAELFLHPGEHPAARDRARYPRARVEVVGSPRLDALPVREPGPPAVAFSFHWDTPLAPETRSTFIYFRAALAAFASQAAADGVAVLGHGHPRIFERLKPWYERKGIEPVRLFEDVCRRADAYVMDGVSTLYEFASTGRPVVVLNAPFYRREVDHGLRFWSASGVGENVWDPQGLGAAVRSALRDPGRLAAQREEALDQVYAHRHGASERAAAAIADWAHSPSTIR